MIETRCLKNVVISIQPILSFVLSRKMIPNKLVTFDDKDPPWMTEKLKEKIKGKLKVYRDFLKNGKTEADYMHVHHAITEVSQLVLEIKDKYYNKLSMKLNNSKTSSKTYWSILKTFYNGKKNTNNTTNIKGR